MPKYRVLVRPTGLLNAQPWPEAGETIELHEAVAEGMVGDGHLEPVKAEKVETRPAPKDKVETRPARKTAAPRKAAKPKE